MDRMKAALGGSGGTLQTQCFIDFFCADFAHGHGTDCWLSWNAIFIQTLEQS